MNNKLGRILRAVLIVFMGLTAAMNLLGGAGTTCAAFLTKNYPSMSSLLGYTWIYQVFVVVTLLIGIAGVWLTIGLARGNPKAFRQTLVLLLAGTVVAGVHMGVSLWLRGKAVPANMKLYSNLITLAIALLFLVPGVRERVDLTRPGGKADRTPAAGMAAIVAGFALLTVAYWAGPTHTYEGVNWVLLLYWPLNGIGALLTLSGLALLLWAGKKAHRTEAAPGIEPELAAP